MEPLIYEVFLVLHPASSRLPELRRALTALVEGEPAFVDLDVFHRPAADSVLVALHYRERGLDGEGARRLGDIGRGVGLALVDPTRMATDERRAFIEVRLPQFEAVARGLATVHDAMRALNDRLAAARPRATPPDGYPRDRAGAASPPLPLPATATRVVVRVPPLPALRPVPPPVPRRNETAEGRLALARKLADSEVDALGDPAPDSDVHDVATRPLGRRAGSEPNTGDPVHLEDPPAFLDVRYLRGRDWLPVRARALSARGAYLVTGAPARLGDTVHVAVSCGGRTALVRGTVYHVTTADDAVSTGASGFAIRFPEYTCPTRTHLVQVLLAARNAGITLRPPPSRCSVRFPVRWPVQVATPGAQFRAEASDVSSGGLFVATERTLDVGTELRFALPLELATTPIEGTARVTRTLGVDARERGMQPGVGAQIVSMSHDDRVAWSAFLARVRRRTEKRVLIGAAPGRLEALDASLSSAGYTVTSGSDLSLLMRVAELDPCPPDIAVLDVDFHNTAAPSGWIEQVFSTRQVPCVMVGGDAKGARATVDRILLNES